MWVAVVQLWPADMANVFWCALWRTQPMETQGFRGNLPGLCWTVLDHGNAMAELVAQSRQSSAKKKEPPGSLMSRLPASAKRTG